MEGPPVEVEVQIGPQEAAPPGDRFRGTGRSIVRAGAIVAVAFLVSRLLGYVRLVVIGATFSLGGDLDAFFAAFRIPDLIFQLVAAGALSSALIPVLAGLLATDENERAWRVASTVTTLMLLALALLALVVLVLAPVLVPLFTPGFTADQTARTVELTRIMLLSPILLSLGAVATSVLNAGGRFAASAVAPIVYNLAIIGGAVLLSPTMGIAGLAVAVVAGSAGHLLIQLAPLRRLGVRFSPGVRLADPAARRALFLLAPRAIGLGGAQITFLVMTTLASTLPVGSISGFNFAFTVLQIPIGVIGVPLGIVLLPSLSREAALGESERYRELLERALRLLGVLMVGLAGVGIVVAADAVVLLFGYGAIDPATLGPTGAALAVFLVGLPAHALIALLARAFYARQDTLTPVLVALGSVVVNVVVGLAAVGPLGLSGLALAIVVGAWLEAIALGLVLRARTAGFGLAGIVRVLGLAAVAAAVGGGVAYGVEVAAASAWGDAPGRFLIAVRAGTAAAAGGLAFVGLALALRIREVPTIVGLMTDLLRRPRAS